MLMVSSYRRTVARCLLASVVAGCAFPAALAGAAPGVDLRVQGTTLTRAPILNSLAQFALTVENEGDSEARDVRLTLTTSRGRPKVVSVVGACSVDRRTVCSLEPLPAGGRSELSVVVRTSRGGRLVLTVEALASEREIDPSDNRFALVVTVRPCTIAGVRGHDNLIGSLRSDRMCGDAGNDILDAGPGSDRLDGGSGNDRLIGGSGNDVVLARRGNDIVLVRDRQRDRVACGAGRDGVIADRADRIGRDCERIFRR
jgi:hypothetical protein